MRNCGVYKITNPRGAIYIGSSRNIFYRLRRYKYPSYLKNQHKIKRSIEKYGIDSHKVEILCHCHEEYRYEFERYFCLQYDVLNRRNLNLQIPEEGGSPAEISQETRKKMSRSGKKRASMERKKRSELARRTFSGVKHSQEHINKRKMTGKKNPMYGKCGELHHNYGKVYTTAQKEKMSKAQKEAASKEGYVNGRSKKVIDTSNGKIYKCIKDAATEVGIKYRTLVAMVNGRNKNRTTIIIYNERND